MIKKAIFIILLICMISVPVMASSSMYSKSSIFFKLRCNVFTNQTSCESAGCYWYDATCHPFQQISTGEFCFDLKEDLMFCITNTNSYYIIADGVVINV